VNSTNYLKKLFTKSLKQPSSPKTLTQMSQTFKLISVAQKHSAFRTISKK